MVVLLVCRVVKIKCFVNVVLIVVFVVFLFRVFFISKIFGFCCRNVCRIFVKVKFFFLIIWYWVIFGKVYFIGFFVVLILIFGLFCFVKIEYREVDLLELVGLVIRINLNGWLVVFFIIVKVVLFVINLFNFSWVLELFKICKIIFLL